MVLSRTFSGNRAEDQLVLRADDAELVADASDATRLAFGIADKFGTLRQSAEGQVALTISGPGTIVGDNPFSLASSGGVGAVWIRAGAKPGRIRVEARHPGFGAKSAEINVVPAGGNACAI
jgi:beta-galactosidase